MTIRALIADDEPLARRGVRQLLAGHCDVEVVGEARDGREAGQLLAALAPDLVFLDIQMPELDGFEMLAASAPGPSAVIVFITAYDAFALQAFDAEALDYLVKPLNAERFDAMMARARRRIRESRLASENGADGARPLDATRKNWVRAATRTGERLIEPDEITWIEAFDYYVVVHAGGQRFLLRESLASLEARLDASRFKRTHRSALVNLAHIRELRGADRIALSDGAEAPLSRRRRRGLMQAIARLCG